LKNVKKIEDYTFWKILASAERLVIGVSAIGATLIVGGACILRVFNINFAGFEELLILVVMWLYFVGCAYGSYEKSQITADIVEIMMKECFVKEVVRLLRSIVTFTLGAIFMYWAMQLVTWTFTMDTRTPAYRIPVVVGQASVLAGLILVTFYNGVHLYQDFKVFVRRGLKKGGNIPTEAKGGAEA